MATRSASISFNPPANNGGSPIINYTATSTPDNITATGTSSPLTIDGLSEGTSYTFTVHATNSVGAGPESLPSNIITPAAPFTVSHSLLFTSNTGSSFIRETAAIGNRRTFTISFWLNRITAAPFTIFNVAAANVANDHLSVGPDGSVTMRLNNGYPVGDATSSGTTNLGEWNHYVVVVDTTQPIASNRIKIYVDNVLQATTGTEVPLNYECSGINSNTARQYIGKWFGDQNFLNGYLSEFILADGHAYDPSYFGMLQSGRWVPIEYTGGFGVTGFYLPFRNGTSTGTLAYDFSSTYPVGDTNPNNWLALGISVPANWSTNTPS